MSETLELKARVMELEDQVERMMREWQLSLKLERERAVEKCRRYALGNFSPTSRDTRWTCEDLIAEILES